jgi:hypothetical protein
MDIYDTAPEIVVEATANARTNLRVSRISAAVFLTTLERQKLKRFASAIAAHIGDL